MYDFLNLISSKKENILLCNSLEIISKLFCNWKIHKLLNHFYLLIFFVLQPLRYFILKYKYL